MTPQELKNSVLKQALRGKLTEQFTQDGTGEMLLQQIQAGKQALIKAGKIKKEKPLPEITEEDVYFDIPDTWAWCYIGDVFQHNTGKALNSTNRDGTILQYITTSNLYWNRFELDKLKEMPFTDAEVEKCTVQKGDLLVCEGGDCGRAAIWTYEMPMRIQNHIHRLRPYSEVCVDYFYYVFYLYKNAGWIAGKGIGIQGLSSNALHTIVAPLPPLAEQKRIVAKLEEILPLIDRYEAAWNKLEEFNKRFPGDMQKSILQLAIQGKLVEQRPEEGTGEELFQQIQAEKQALIKSGKIKIEKPLPEIAEDEIPFDIPETWKWARVLDIAYLNSGNQYEENANGSLYVKVADMNLPDNQTEIKTSTRRADIPSKDLISVNSIIFPKRGGAIATNKKRMVCQEPIGVDSNTMAMTMISAEMLPYISKWFASVDLGQLVTGTSVPQINNKDIYPLLIPVPPLAEQKRIVAKLEEILPLCDRLK